MKETTYSATINFGDKSGCTIVGGNTIGEVMAEIFKEASYYVANYDNVTANITKYCKPCHGTGEVPKKGSRGLYSHKLCKDCKGKSKEVIAENIPLTISECVSVNMI